MEIVLFLPRDGITDYRLAVGYRQSMTDRLIVKTATAGQLTSGNIDRISVGFRGAFISTGDLERDYQSESAGSKKRSDSPRCRLSTGLSGHEK